MQTKSIEIQSSVVGYVAKCVALFGKGDVHAGCRACDTALMYFYLNHVAILLLIKVGISYNVSWISFNSVLVLGCCPVHGRRA